MAVRKTKRSARQTFLFGEAAPDVDSGDLIFDYFAGGGAS